MGKPDYLIVGHESYVRVLCRNCDCVRLHLTKIYQIKGAKIFFNKICVKCFEDAEEVKKLGINKTADSDFEKVSFKTWIWLQVNDT